MYFQFVHLVTMALTAHNSVTRHVVTEAASCLVTINVFLVLLDGQEMTAQQVIHLTPASPVFRSLRSTHTGNRGYNRPPVTGMEIWLDANLHS